MKFGPVPLAKAEGAVLAHSMPVAGGRLRKGKVLTVEDLSALAQAGQTSVTVARLDANDVNEDAAALTLAQALTKGSAGVALQAVGTGRVNLLAEGPGLARIDAAKVHAVNAADPSITLATVPEWQRMEPGGMIATVKIIAYAVPAASLSAACTTGEGALTLASPRIARASLIQTTVDADATPDKGHRVTAGRLARLGVSLTDPVMVPHEETALATALQHADGEVLLILTGSATSDLRDVAPQALRQAGGQVTHFGMPVDPGNLLFIGELTGRPVIGLPGCARSPALNGADWVMERLICGVAVGPGEIRRMGVGGLLKEIPSRPRPRKAASGV